MATTKQIKKWIIKHITAIRIGIVVSMFGMAIWAITLSTYELVIGHSELALWVTEALVMVGPELAGIVIGVVAIDYLNELRQAEQLKAQLIRQMGSGLKDVSLPAVKEIAYHGWIRDGSLVGASLAGAYLVGANLEGANLKGADLRNSSLKDAHLKGACLEHANLFRAYMLYANLRDVHMKRSDLRFANLERTLWRDAHLDGANLSEANLAGALELTKAQLKSVKTTEGAIMPDGTKLKKIDDREPYLDGPTLEEWLTTRPDCLIWPSDEKTEPL